MRGQLRFDGARTADSQRHAFSSQGNDALGGNRSIASLQRFRTVREAIGRKEKARQASPKPAYRLTTGGSHGYPAHDCVRRSSAQLQSSSCLGDDPGGIVTIILGILGSLLGGFLFSIGLGGGERYAGWIGSTNGAIILLLIYRPMAGRRTAH
jgi:uncharacterized membrane protein YeaQ/YmgE (transglycosylase-associated protein family)